jgi:hypothetical protein
MSTPAQIIVADDLNGGKEKNGMNYGGGGDKLASSSSSSSSPSAPISSVLFPQPGTAVSIVPIVAPSNLPENYSFDAVHDGVVFPVTVPVGGVRVGQTFMVPFLPLADAYAVEAVEVVATEVTPLTTTGLVGGGTDGGGGHRSTVVTTATIWESNGTSYGRWKDGLCDCCSFGCCHPSLLNSICFPQLLMGQVRTPHTLV